MGELGAARRYSYWSDRAVQRIAQDNNVKLSPNWRSTVKSPSVAGAQVEFAQEPPTARRHEIAQSIERTIGQLAVEDFVTPPPVSYAKGASPVTFAFHTRWKHTAQDGLSEKGVIFHTRVKGSDGSRVEVCLFGSVDNCAGYLGVADIPAPRWSSSSTWAIEEFIASKGIKPAPGYDNDESIAIEILRVLNNEGMIGRHSFTAPASSEWFADVYKDIELDKDRWNLRPGPDLPIPFDRIVIGAPLWVRSNSS